MREMANGALVALDRVSKSYEQKVAVKDLTLSIDPGAMFGLLGPNGSGKTSSIRMMIGITVPDSGTVELFGQPFDRKNLHRVGYLPEERGLYKKMKVIDQLIFLGAASRPRRRLRHASVPTVWCEAPGDHRGHPQEDRRALQGHAAEDPVHRRAAARARADHHGRALQRPRPRQRHAAAGHACRPSQARAEPFSFPPIAWTRSKNSATPFASSIAARLVLSGGMREIKSRYERNHVVS